MFIFNQGQGRRRTVRPAHFFHCFYKIPDFSGGIVRCDLAVLVAEKHLPGFMTHAFGPQPATEGVL